MTSDSDLCLTCKTRRTMAAFTHFCSLDCREDYFSALGAGDTRETSIHLDSPHIGGTV